MTRTQEQMKRDLARQNGWTLFQLESELTCQGRHGFDEHDLALWREAVAWSVERPLADSELEQANRILDRDPKDRDAARVLATIAQVRAMRVDNPIIDDEPGEGREQA